jgi:hypothetical protein
MDENTNDDVRKDDVEATPEVEATEESTPEPATEETPAE